MERNQKKNRETEKGKKENRRKQEDVADSITSGKATISLIKCSEINNLCPAIFLLEVLYIPNIP
jgi:hypothetical protein